MKNIYILDENDELKKQLKQSKSLIDQLTDQNKKKKVKSSIMRANINNIKLQRKREI